MPGACVYVLCKLMREVLSCGKNACIIISHEKCQPTKGKMAVVGESKHRDTRRSLMHTQDNVDHMYKGSYNIEEGSIGTRTEYQ
jgi:hypothetical protein